MRNMHPFSDPYSMLVGRVGAAPIPTFMGPPPATAALAPQIPMAPYPVGVATGGCGAPATYGDGCYPLGWCPPQAPGFYSQAAASAVASQAPQTALGINSLDQAPNTPIAALSSRTLSTSPSLPICVTDFRVSRSVSPFFQISSIRAARMEYLTDNQSISADTFSADSLRPPLRMPQISAGSNITVTVVNITDEAHHFYGNFFGFPGPSCEPCL